MISPEPFFHELTPSSVLALLILAKRKRGVPFFKLLRR